jgi:SAM-dependent methyltransferase
LRQLARTYPGGIFGESEPRQRFLRSLPANGRVLEIGCGRGENCALLRKLHPQVEIHGLDLLPPAEVPDFVHYRQHDLEREPLPYRDAYFDGILLIHVLEHLHHPIRLCSEIQRMLTPRGSLYVEAPNYTSVLVPSFSLRRHQHHPFNFFDDIEHVRPYTKQALFEFIERCGLHLNIVANARNWLRFPLDLIAFPVALLRGDRPQAVRRFWNLWGWCIFAVGTKEETATGNRDL